MHDARPRRDHAKALEGLLAPAQELVALAVALELPGHVEQERGVRAELVDLHGVVDHEVDGLLWVDPRGVAAEIGHRVAHRGEVDDRRHPGEVLQQHAGRAERDLLGRLGARLPRAEGADLFGVDGRAVLAAKQVLEQDAQRERQPREVEPERLGRAIEPVDRVRAAAHREGGACVEGVERGYGFRHCGGSVPGCTRHGSRQPAEPAGRRHEPDSTRRPVRTDGSDWSPRAYT